MNLESSPAARGHQERLQDRLRKIDDALDRLMSGSYGSCSRCGRWIEDTKLDSDPAIEFCVACWELRQNRNRPQYLRNEMSKLREESSTRDLSLPLSEISSTDGVAVETLAPFDTICVRTHNSMYRIFLLDPRTGRALIEGGPHLLAPVEGTVTGSTLGASDFRNAWIGVGFRMGLWADGRFISTSPVQSFHLEHSTSDRSASAR